MQTQTVHTWLCSSEPLVDKQIKDAMMVMMMMMMMMDDG